MLVAGSSGTVSKAKIKLYIFLLDLFCLKHINFGLYNYCHPIKRHLDAIISHTLELIKENLMLYKKTVTGFKLVIWNDLGYIYKKFLSIFFQLQE